MNVFQRSHRVEKQGRGLTPAQIVQLRQKQATPILDRFKIWLDAKAPIVPPKSLLGVRSLVSKVLRIDHEVEFSLMQESVIGTDWFLKKLICILSNGCGML